MDSISPMFWSRSIDQFGGKIPFIVSDLINALNSESTLNTEGIFRISGSSHDISIICSHLDQGRIPDYSIYRKNIHNLTGALKKFFRDSITTDPIIPFDMYNDFVSVPQLPEDVQATRYKELLNKMTKPRRLTLVLLFQFLHEVANHADKNKMKPLNITICFAPNLLASSPSPSQEETVLNNTRQNEAVKLLLTKFDEIFGDIEIPESAFLTDEDMEIIRAPPIPPKDIGRFMQLRTLRKQSLIPFVPHEFLHDPSFIRPTTPVEVPPSTD